MNGVNPALSTRGLVKRFSGVLASDNVDFDLLPGEVHAIIGPNGAGKTTFIKQITGEHFPTAGRITLGDTDITRMRTDRRILLGLGRSFQVTSVLRDLTVLENVILAVQAKSGHSFKFWHRAVEASELREPALATLADVGLRAKADLPSRVLAYGELRQLEMAMVIASNPQVLLLDEPMAGMGTVESRLMVELLQSFRGRFSTILVEHDMDAVFALADRISVLVYGRIIATGSPAEIRENPQVRASYLGEAA
ncbi:ABC transporter ATP-binding protein [Pseudolabrys taiwanensis]|uniref:ABC transporter ATP-binding protein n=1 Tax=Pseudolabrys taiwanensis TaxID=331696 RepID=A0A346A149_9HYPH|nr:ABC transporter ATP-binding protein [Pseudolabrys taiwanensis]AXK82896.1 ABC transporter ATP-binding protein [Pseudolabrys taiwanensis]